MKLAFFQTILIVSDDNFASIHVNSDHDKYFFEIYFVGLTHFSVFLSVRKLGQLVKMLWYETTLKINLTSLIISDDSFASIYVNTEHDKKVLNFLLWQKTTLKTNLTSLIISDDSFASIHVSTDGSWKINLEKTLRRFDAFQFLI